MKKHLVDCCLNLSRKIFVFLPMNALGNMKALSDALDPNSRERLQSPELWTRLEVYRAAATSSLNGQLGEPECTKMASGLLKGIELRILFIAVDYAHQHGDETKRRAIGYVLVFIFASSMGPDLYEVGDRYPR